MLFINVLTAFSLRCSSFFIKLFTTTKKGCANYALHSLFYFFLTSYTNTRFILLIINKKCHFKVTFKTFLTNWMLYSSFICFLECSYTHCKEWSFCCWYKITMCSFFTFKHNHNKLTFIKTCF